MKQYQSRLTREQSKKDKKAGKLLCNWKFETRKPNYLKSCSPLYCAESDLPAIQNAQLEVSFFTSSSSFEPESTYSLQHAFQIALLEVT